MERIPMTAGGYRHIQEELRQLKSADRPEVIRAIAEAREHGDLSENAEYHAAKERQSFIEGRIAELEDKLARAEVIDPSTLAGDRVTFGTRVTVADMDTDEEATYELVGEFEADLDRGRISITAPIAKAMIGKAVGDTFEVTTPGGTRGYEVIEVTVAN